MTSKHYTKVEGPNGLAISRKTGKKHLTEY